VESPGVFGHILQMVQIGQAGAIRTIAAKYGDLTEMKIGADGFAPLAK
jgi:zinc protease